MEPKPEAAADPSIMEPTPKRRTMDPALKRDLEKALLRSEDEEAMSRKDPAVVQNLLQMRLKYEKVSKA